MRQYLLDSAVLSAYMRARPAALALAQAWVHADEATTSIVCVGEVAEYLKGFSTYLEHWRAFRTLLMRVHPYPLTYAISQRYADLRRALRPPYGPGLIGDMDTLIAATALEYGLTLVTTDSDFTRVPNLTVRLLPPGSLRSTTPAP
ncbi:MAG TPA: type II toxin-antitoxin system VapC family toxin [Ktedonobacterales bacterium]|jgi:predicted nucleic acid-binding protein